MDSTKGSFVARGDNVIELETAYLDLDGDGVPDAIEIVEAVTADLTGDGIPNVVAVRKEFATGIDIDGIPRRVSTVEQRVIAPRAGEAA